VSHQLSRPQAWAIVDMAKHNGRAMAVHARTIKYVERFGLVVQDATGAWWLTEAGTQAAEREAVRLRAGIS
jgi:hypothetical protein